MASDETLRNGVRANLAAWIEKLECGGDLEKQAFFKKRFIQRLRDSPVAIDTEKANEQHYEVPTEFFLTVLGKRLKYSGCYWPEGVSTLEEVKPVYKDHHGDDHKVVSRGRWSLFRGEVVLQNAEDISLKLICERAGVKDGQTVLDLGCGWGSLSLYICEKFPKCNVTCVSNSNTQRQLIQDRALQRGYQGRLECITADANVFTTAKRFDRIISIEMFEHMKNYEILMQRVSSWLKPSGKLFIQVLCHRLHPYAFDTKPGSDTEWMAKNFFTGGTMPSVDLYLYFQNGVRIENYWIINGQHYSKTLEAWLEKLDQNRDKVMQILTKAYGRDAEQQMFNWRLFFIFCSEVFGYSGGNEWIVSQHLFKKNQLSLL